MYIDGIAQGQGNMEKGHVIRDGAVVLGQEQDTYKGGFDKTQSLQGSGDQCQPVGQGADSRWGSSPCQQVF